jgi:hypothetical protein
VLSDRVQEYFDGLVLKFPWAGGEEYVSPRWKCYLLACRSYERWPMLSVCCLVLPY